MLLNNCSGVRFVKGKRLHHLRATLVLLVAAGTMLTGTDAQQLPQDSVTSSSPSFEVAAIKANRGDNGDHDVDWSADRLLIGNYTLKGLIRIAYDLKSDKQIIGGPEWLDKQAFDISAKIDDAEMTKMRQMKRNERRKESNLLLQSLLAERFQLRTHAAQQIMPIYALVVAKSGPKLTPSKSSGQGYHVSTHNNHMVATAASMDIFADQLTGMSESGERVVLNRTGLSGEYDFKLDWSPDYGGRVAADPVDPSLFTALQEQLGLKLESQKGSVNIVVIESAAQPTFD